MKFKVTGAAALEKKLKALAYEGSKKANRRAVNAGTTPLLRAVKAATPTDSGSLRRAMTKKVSGKGYAVNGKVGAARDYVGPDGQQPAHYLHLVELGHIAEDGTAVPPAAPLRKGYDSGVGPARAAYQAKLKDQIEKEAMK